jgi:universal stress protein A
MPAAPAPEIVRFDHNEEALERLRDLVPDSFKGTWDVEVSTGKTADAILRTAQDQNVDLIVMGTHGRTGLSHTLFGSVAEAVMHHAKCPVLMVRYGT